MTVTGDRPRARRGDADGGGQVFRLMRNLVFAVAVFVVGVVVVVLTSGEGDGNPGRVGPPFGADVDDYVAGRHERLEALDGPTRAVVSFDDYVSVERASSIVTAEVERWLLAAPGATPRVAEDPRRWREEFADAARDEAAELETLVPTVDDPDFVAQYEADIDRAHEIVEALDAGDPVVFGVVITSGAADLRRLTEVRGIRLVDPIEPEARGEPRGLRPEETRSAGDPPERPLG